MLNTDEIRDKEVINICDGKSLGYVEDIEINIEKGTIEAIIIPGNRSFFSLFAKGDEELTIKWTDVKTVGEDVILVELMPGAYV